MVKINNKLFNQSFKTDRYVKYENITARVILEVTDNHNDENIIAVICELDSKDVNDIIINNFNELIYEKLRNKINEKNKEENDNVVLGENKRYFLFDIDKIELVNFPLYTRIEK